MKHYFLIFALILVATVCMAQDINFLTGHVEIGWCPLADTWGRESWIDNEQFGTSDFLTYIEVDFRLNPTNWFFIGGALKNYQLLKDQGIAFKVITIDFKATLGFRFSFRETTMEFGFRHFCGHPVVGAVNPVIDANRAYEEVYFRFEF